MRRCKSLHWLKSLLCRAPQLSGSSVLCFFIMSLLRVCDQGGSSGNCYVSGILFESWVPSGLTIRVAVMRWLDNGNILFTDTTGSIFFFSLMRAQSRMLEWVAMPYSRGSSHPRDWTHISFVSCIGRQIVYHYSEKEFILFPLYLPEKGRTVVLGCNIKK